MLKLYNTLTRKKQEFKAIGKEVGIYSCGPTVYWYQHIGNLRTYIFSDILKRVLLFDGFKVKQVMNVTDVGHLTSDADEGEDKMEKAAAKEGKKASDIANYYWEIFKEDFKKLNILEPDIWSKATEHIKEQIELIKKLEAKGYTYKTADGIYFDTSKFKDYGKLAKLKKEGLQAGKRISMGDKKNITDFALWKFSTEIGKRQQEWNSPWGIGFPGWHIECSAMSMKYLGETFDIHTGGEDHVPIHHTNEIAQSEAATGKKFVNYWLHGAFLTFKGEKVSKSKGGLYIVSELEELGYKALDYRYLCLGSHYRTQMDFSLENLKNAQNAYQRLKNIIQELKDDNKINERYLKDFEKAIDDDLNMPEALQVLWKMLRDGKASGKIKTIEKMDEVLGLDLLKKVEEKIPEEIKKLVEEREKARKAKDWKKSDELRERIKALGFEVADAAEGARVRKIQ
ncbi:MAG: cysteine--tRNA ligase [Candidatus Pacearchaeota archaeon]|nr:cysteine--tRNA ligase [Candidatus Pacearchaeota archaeon]